MLPSSCSSPDYIPQYPSLDEFPELSEQNDFRIYRPPPFPSYTPIDLYPLSVSPPCVASRPSSPDDTAGSSSRRNACGVPETRKEILESARAGGFDRKEIVSEVNGSEVIDTEALCFYVNEELTRSNISQTAFAQNIIGRCQGTFSDIIRNPKPWSQLKSGRSTYFKMLNWLDMDPEERQRAVWKELPKKKTKKTGSKRKNISGKERVVFNALQKQTLEHVFDQFPFPSREMQEVIAEQLELSLATVINYFMNARRKKKMAQF